MTRAEINRLSRQFRIQNKTKEKTALASFLQTPKRGRDLPQLVLQKPRNRSKY
jgi:hypothetical protein